jgi:hypothetical protein
VMCVRGRGAVIGCFGVAQVGRDVHPGTIGTTAGGLKPRTVRSVAPAGPAATQFRTPDVR